MKRLVYHHEIETNNESSKEDIYGMSRVGYIPLKQVTLEVYVNTDDPGKIPHFHIRDKDNWHKFHTCIEIERAQYFHHGNKTKSLNSKERRALQEFMEAPSSQKLYNEDGSRLNNWQVICQMWDANNSDVEIDEFTIQPDYTMLPDKKDKGDKK